MSLGLEEPHSSVLSYVIIHLPMNLSDSRFFMVLIGQRALDLQQGCSWTLDQSFKLSMNVDEDVALRVLFHKLHHCKPY